MSKKFDFTKSVQRVIRKQSLPNSLEEFLNDSLDEKKQDTLDESQIVSEKKIVYKREEFKLSYHVAESLRVASYKLKRTKKDIVQEALEDFFIKNSL